MCGFGGILNFNSRIHRQEVLESAQAVSFRGPDHTAVNLYEQDFSPAEGTGPIALFFNRLAILDLDSRSNQPFENERYILLFNGEIYNYVELREELVRNKIEFTTSSDTEVLFKLLIQYGPSVISRLNGMFAFVLLDKQERKILLARDRAGIKPLHYRLDSSGFTFASESDSIIRLSRKPAKISGRAVHLFLSLQYIPTPLTIWEGIFKLPPGHYLEASMDELPAINELRSTAYWDAYEQALKPAEKQEDLENLLTGSLEMQLRSDVPLGLFLSSGIDSSLLAALINKKYARERTFDFFTVAFDSRDNIMADESGDASQFLKGFNNPAFTHHLLHINPEVILDELTTMYRYMDEPFGDYAVMLNYVISKKAKEHVTVVLSGDGSDELFWGYQRYNQWKAKAGEGQKTKRFINELAGVLPESAVKRNIRNRYATDPVEQYIGQVSSGYFSKKIVSEKGLWWLDGLDAIREEKSLPSLVDFKTYLPDCMFYKVDRSSMGASLEVRVPFVDNHIMDHALAMDRDKKSTEWQPAKAPLKEMLIKLAPQYKTDLPKRGFSLPLKSWISYEWKDMVHSTGMKQNLKLLGLSGVYEQLLKDHYDNNRDRSLEIWRMLNLALWYGSKQGMVQ